MKKAYWIVQVDITQPEAFAAYVAANGEALARYGARFLARAGEHCVVEGQARARNTIVSFLRIRPRWTAGMTRHIRRPGSCAMAPR